MAAGSIAKILGKGFQKGAPKLAEKGLKELAGKGGKEIAEHIFKSLGKGSIEAGKKAFGELAKKAAKGDKDAIIQLKDIAKSIKNIPGIGKDALGLVVKTFVNAASPFGGGDTVRKIFGLSGNAASALKAGDGLL
jgi:hypothetical protein